MNNEVERVWEETAKLKVSFPLIVHYAIKTCTLDLGIRQVSGHLHLPAALPPEKRVLDVLLVGKYVVGQSRCRGEEKYLPLLGGEPRSLKQK
jgi:hypothetical protein